MDADAGGCAVVLGEAKYESKSGEMATPGTMGVPEYQGAGTRSAAGAPGAVPRGCARYWRAVW